MNKLWASHKQVMNKLWTSQEQVVNKSWTSHEQVSNKSEQFLQSTSCGQIINKLYLFTWSLFLTFLGGRVGAWVVMNFADIKAISAQHSWSWGWAELGKNTHFCRNSISKGWNVVKFSCPGKKFCVRNVIPRKKFLLQEAISSHKEKFPIIVKKITVKKRNILWQDKIPSHRKKFPVTGKNFLSEKDISCYRKKCHRKKFHIRGQNFKPEEDISWGKKYPFKGRNFWSQEGMPCHRKKYPFTRKKSLSKNKIFCCSKKFSVTGSNFLFSSVNAFMS